MLRALNGNPHQQQFRILLITGIRSGILEHAGPRLPDVRRPSPPSELWTILEENRHSFLMVEHRA